MVENNLKKISYEEIDDDVTRHNRMRILINIARNHGQKGINFIKSIDLDEEYNKGLSTYKEFPEVARACIELSINRRKVNEPDSLDWMYPKPLYFG